MAAITSKATGNWSDGSTWDSDPAIPANGDTVTIANTHTVTLNSDLIGGAVDLAGLTIDAGGTLLSSTAAGTYSILCSADINVNGILQAGTSTSVPLPSDVTSTIDFDGTASSAIINDATGQILLYCIEPTNKYVSLTATEPAAETVMAVDTDVSSDWTVGDKVAIVNMTKAGAPPANTVEEDTIAGMTATTITLTGGLAAEKLQGSVIFLIDRNIRIINSTTYAIEQGSTNASYIGAEIYDCTYASNSCENITFAGAMLLDTGYIANASTNVTFNGCAAPLSTGSGIRGLYTSYGITTSSDSFLGGFYYANRSNRNVTSGGLIVGSDMAFSDSLNLNVTGDIRGVENVFNNSHNIFFTGDSSAVEYTFNSCTGIICANNSIGGTTGAVGSDYDFFNASNIKCYNTSFNATTENSGYDSATFQVQSNYAESSDHDQTTNAYKAWTLGGVVTSQTASPPTGYDRWYKLTAEDTTATYPVFRQYETVVQPGTALEVEGYLAIPNAEDMSGCTIVPQLQIIDKFADPLVDSTQSPLDYDEIPISDGSETGWQEVSVIWANTGDSPRNVIVRMITDHDGGVDDVDISSAWSIATYQDQIAALYNSLIPIRTDVAVQNTSTSFTLTAGQAATNSYRYNTIAVQDADDGHWEQRKILAWTSGRVATVDNSFSFTPAVGDLAYILSVGYGEVNSVISGTVPDNTSTADSIKLESNASGANDIYNENLIILTGGTGVGQARLIADYIGATTTAVVRSSWVTTPDDTTTYRIIPFSGILLANTGLCAGGSSTTITLNASAPATADIYVGHTVYISGGTGEGQARLITGYTVGRVATVFPAWDVSPAAVASVYLILPIGVGNIYGTVVDILADTNEIQGKLPDNYIMGSSDTEDHDDEIDAIKASLGQVHTVEDESPGAGGRPDRTAGITEGC